MSWVYQTRLYKKRYSFLSYIHRETLCLAEVGVVIVVCAGDNLSFDDVEVKLSLSSLAPQ